jgi:hypothetical protein
MNIHYVYESLFVGIYSCILYTLVPIRDPRVALFVIGFIKHYLANWIGIHDYYCSNGNACGRSNSKYVATQLELIIESVGEGFLFLIFGALLMRIQKNKFIVYFMIGLILHLIFELIGFHRKICAYRCRRL